MNVDSAIQIINNLVFIPNWKFTATDHTDRFEGTVLVRVDYPARASERAEAAQNYPTEICTHANFPLMVEECEDEDDLVFCMILQLLKVQLHEIREFLRVPTTYWAPFHPHRVGGMRRWAQKVREMDSDFSFLGGDVLADLLFGLG